MKTFTFLVVTLFTWFTLQAQTHTDLTTLVHEDYLRAEKELQTVYQKILKEYRTDTAFTKNLKASQKAWTKFRYAEMHAIFPDREPYYYGSSFGACWSAHLIELTKQRTKRLRIWLTGVEESDVCSGSVKTRQIK
jgi:uncharacterized protein YecT (DUF1311 family)